MKEEQKSLYGFITQSQIDELPTSTPEEEALKKQMESLLEGHLAYITAKKTNDERDMEDNESNSDEDSDSDGENISNEMDVENTKGTGGIVLLSLKITYLHVIDVLC
jgi:hypothetical protein